MVTDTVEINDLTPFQTVIEESPRKQQPARNHWSVGFKVELKFSSMEAVATCYRVSRIHRHLL